jgi:4-hydroxybenzoate polyprenyltransferase
MQESVTTAANRITPGNWTLYFGLSRTPHAVLDMATPAMAALLWLGHFPSIFVILVGSITAFAGYTAVYALNDLIDYRIDIERLSLRTKMAVSDRVDEVMTRHPIAQGLLSFRSALRWMAFWGIIALLGAWWLNYICALIFIGAALLEITYCKLLKITHLKIIPSAFVKASGGIAGVYAVDPSPAPVFIAIILLWLAAWEVGGQNIANDIIDMEDDEKVFAKTTLTVKGMRQSIFMIVAGSSAAMACSIAAYWISHNEIGFLYTIGAILLNWELLLKPARKLFGDPTRENAATLFNKASYMPLCFLILIGSAIILNI